MKRTTLNLALAITLVCSLWMSGCSRSTDEIMTTDSREAQRLYKEGVGLYEKFYYDEALAALDSSIAADSLFALPWIYKAALTYHLGGEPESRVLIATAVRLAVNASPQEQLLARMWFFRIHFDPEKTASVADSLITQYPVLRDPYIVRGELFRANQHLEQAVAVWEKALSADSSNSRALMWLGYANSELGDPRKGLTYMKRYIRLVPDAADPRASTGDILMGMGQYDEALTQYKKALELKPTFWYAYQRIGDIYALYGRLKEAEREHLRAMEALPRQERAQAMVLANSARFNILRGRYEDAEKESREALAIDSNNTGAYYRLIVSLVSQSKLQEARTALEALRTEFDRRRISVGPERSYFFLASSMISSREGNEEKALEACDSAMQYARTSDRGEIYRMIATIRLRSKEYEAALDACEEALRVAPNSPGSLLTVLKVYHAKGDRTMTKEIGDRLLGFWKDADPDFQPLQEVRTAMRRSRPS